MTDNAGSPPRVVCVLNRQSGGGALAAQWPSLARRLEEEGYSFDLLPISPDQLMADLAGLLSESPVQAVIGVGGDGTHWSVLNALKNCAIRVPGLQLPPYLAAPFGTGNNIAKSLGFRPSRLHPWDDTIAALHHGVAVPLDLGKVDDKWFADSISIGLDAAILARRNGMTRALSLVWRRIIHGYVIYGAAGFATICARPRHQCEISLDGESWYCGPFTGILINDTRIYGGIFDPTPEARHDDGELDVALYRTRLSYLVNCLLSLRFQPMLIKRLLGRRTRWLGIQHGRCRSVRVALEPAAPFQIDGEWQGLGHDLRAAAEPNAIQVLTLPTR